MAKKRFDPRDLWPHTAFAQPQHYDFGANHESEAWTFPFSIPESRHDEFQPMMNTLWPLEEFEHGITKFNDASLRKALDDAGAVTLIQREDDGEYYLALAGGGMDLSWDIAAGYVNLGQLPPFRVCERLPEYSGAKYDDTKHRNVILACQRSISFVESRAGQAKKEIQRYVDKTYGSKWIWEDGAD